MSACRYYSANVSQTITFHSNDLPPLYGIKAIPCSKVFADENAGKQTLFMTVFPEVQPSLVCCKLFRRLFFVITFSVYQFTVSQFCEFIQKWYEQRVVLSVHKFHHVLGVINFLFVFFHR